jgi:hypothetical protein
LGIVVRIATSLACFIALLAGAGTAAAQSRHYVWSDVTAGNRASLPGPA